MKKILITGGNGDIATGLNNVLSPDFEVHTPSKDELNVSCIESVEHYFNNKTFDFVINAAGTLYSSLIEYSEPKLWIRDIEVNLIGTFLVSRKAVITNPNVRIINVCSTAAFYSYKDWTSYCASKSGTLSLSKGMSIGGFDVITVCCGAIDTKLRNGLTIPNSNIMTVQEAIMPIINSVYGSYQSGDVVFYRKNTMIVNPTSKDLKL